MEIQRYRERGERRELKYQIVEREISGGKKGGIIFFFFLEYCYSTILKLELYCSTIAKKFAIIGFGIP